MVGHLSEKSKHEVYNWSKSGDLGDRYFAPYPYRDSFKTLSGVFIQFADAGADIPDVRIELNPAKHKIAPAIVTELVSLLKYVRPTRLDFAIDYPFDLSSFHYSTDTPRSGAIWYGRSGKAETFYLGRGQAGDKYRVYNKAKEQKLKDETWWRVELQMNLRPDENWRDRNPFADLHITKPAEYLNVIDRAVMRELKENPQAWGELTDYQRRKYRRMMNGKDEGSTLYLTPSPLDVFTSERWKVDACLNEYLKLMKQPGQ
jgi:hypothetical protein